MNFFLLFIALSFLALDLRINARYDPDLDSDNLFANDTNVISLTDETLNQNLLHQKNSFLLLLYSHACPNCNSILLEMKQFSKQVYPWHSVFRMAVLNCITFPMVCLNFKVTNSPSYILIPSNVDEIPKNSTEQLLYFSQIRPEVFALIQSQTELMNSNNLLPTLVVAKQEICNLFQFQNRVVFPFAILESSFITQHDGLELLLDLLDYRESIQIRRFYTPNLELIESFNVSNDNLPALFAVNIDHANCSFSLISKYQSSNAPSFHQTAIQHITTKFPLDLGRTTSMATTTESPGEHHLHLPLSGLTSTDLYNTLQFALVKDMYRFEVFKKVKIDILKEFYLVMHTHFPFRNENVRRFFKRMNIWWSKRPKDKDIMMINYREATRISDGFLMPLTNWRHCRGSKPYYRGYSCGLWSLFHVLTVQEYDNFKHPRPPKIVYTNHNHRNQNAQSSAQNQSATPIMKHSALRSMINFIPQFYSCPECARNFERSTKDFESQLVNPESSILYLWRLHNQVNARLTNDPSTDPYFPKHQFPSRELCPQCSDLNGLFNETEVLKFLLNHYGRQTLRSNTDN